MSGLMQLEMFCGDVKQTKENGEARVAFQGLSCGLQSFYSLKQNRFIPSFIAIMDI